MQPDINAQLGSFFDDEQPHFSQKMRGYDPDEVDRHLHKADDKMRALRETEQALKQELAYAHRQMQGQEKPTYSGLAMRIEQLLPLAEDANDDSPLQRRRD